MTPETTSFGACVYAHRMRQGLRQATVAARAGISGGYFSELENSKRHAPPQRTVRRIAHALDLCQAGVEQLSALADRERATALDESHLPAEVRNLLCVIRASAQSLDSALLESLQQQITEALM